MVEGVGVSRDSVLLSWLPPANPNGRIILYKESVTISVDIKNSYVT